jgi:hypothetical protein
MPKTPRRKQQAKKRKQHKNFFCFVCSKPVLDESSFQCDGGCEGWAHSECLRVTQEEYEQVNNEELLVDAYSCEVSLVLLQGRTKRSSPSIPRKTPFISRREPQLRTPSREGTGHRSWESRRERERLEDFVPSSPTSPLPSSDSSSISRTENAISVAQELAFARSFTEGIPGRKGVSWSEGGRLQAVQNIVEVALAVRLTGAHGDATILRMATMCGEILAGNVLRAIREKRIDTLFKRKLRFDSFKRSEHYSKFQLFCYEPEVSRHQTGSYPVRVGFKKYLPRFTLSVGRGETAQKYLDENPSCLFTRKIIAAAIPIDVQPPGAQDIQRNACPWHSNFRRLVQSLNNKLDPADKLDKSVTGLLKQHVCGQDSDALKWKDGCVSRKCKVCPVSPLRTLKAKLTRAQLDARVPTMQWAYSDVSYTDKKSGELIDKRKQCLVPSTPTLSEALALLTNQVKSMLFHVKVTVAQWAAMKNLREQLLPGSGHWLVVVDYQRNLLLEYGEETTGRVFGGSQEQATLYPVVAETRLENGTLFRVGLCFMSGDTIHDFHGVHHFDKLTIAYIRETLGMTCSGYIRFSDGCKAQFKSRRAVIDLERLAAELGLDFVSFHFFASHEGKNLSDQLGSIMKAAYFRIRLEMLASDQFATEVLSALVACSLMGKRLEVASERRKGYQHIHLQYVDVIDHVREDVVTNRAPLSHIMQKHMMLMFRPRSGPWAGKMRLMTAQYTCSVCQTCRQGDFSKCAITNWTSEPLCLDALAAEDDAGSDEEEVEVASSEELSDVDAAGSQSGESDAESDPEAVDPPFSDEEEEGTLPGTYVWAKSRQGAWGVHARPARVCTLKDVSNEQDRAALEKMGEKIKNPVIVAWLGHWDGWFAAVPLNNTRPLGTSPQDKRWAARTSNLQETYNSAIAEVS